MDPNSKTKEVDEAVQRLAATINKMANKLGVALFTVTDLKETMEEATRMTAEILTNKDNTIKELQAKLSDTEQKIAKLEKKN